MMYFKSRETARSFARKTGKKIIDHGKAAQKRWAVIVINK